MAQGLRNLSIPFLVLELNARTVREAAAQDVPIRYGDATNPDALQAVGPSRARAAVVLLSDPDATRRAVQAIRRLAPDLPIIARTRYRQEADDLQRHGATLAVAEELEASLEVLAQLFTWLGVPGNALELLVDTFRRDTTAGRPLRAPTQPLMALPEPIQRSPVSTHQLTDGDWAVGRTLGDVDLRSSTGSTVLAIKAGDRYVTSPAASQVLDAGQVLYLLGDESDILLARRVLSAGPIERGDALRG
jgi:CPA2 family monovalent cation:H+ antiporter-2